MSTQKTHLWHRRRHHHGVVVHKLGIAAGDETEKLGLQLAILFSGS